MKINIINKNKIPNNDNRLSKYEEENDINGFLKYLYNQGIINDYSVITVEPFNENNYQFDDEISTKLIVNKLPDGNYQIYEKQQCGLSNFENGSYLPCNYLSFDINMYIKNLLEKYDYLIFSDNQINEELFKILEQ